jgi:hypothetical protein
MRRKSAKEYVGPECQEHIGFLLRFSQMPRMLNVVIKAQVLSDLAYQAYIYQETDE